MLGLEYLKQLYTSPTTGDGSHTRTTEVVEQEDPEATALLAELCDDTVWDPEPSEVEALVRRGADVFHCTPSDMWDVCPIFHFLIYNSRVEAVKACLQSPLPMDFTTIAFRDRTPLHILCLENITDEDTREMLCAIVRRLETHPMDLVQWNQANNTGYSMLSCAARYQKLSLVWPLVRHMPYFQCDCFDFIPLPLVWQWDWDALEEEEQLYFSLERAEVVDVSRPTAELVKLIWQFRLEPWRVQQLVGEGADVLFRDAVYKVCMLHYCLKWVAVDCLRACLETTRPIDFTQTDRYGYTPLHYTVMAVQKAPHLAEELLDAVLNRIATHAETDSVDWGARDLFGRDVLSFAAHSHVLSLVWPTLKRRRVEFFFSPNLLTTNTTTSPLSAVEHIIRPSPSSACSSSSSSLLCAADSSGLTPLPISCAITVAEWWALEEEDRRRFMPPNRDALLASSAPPATPPLSASASASVMEGGAHSSDSNNNNNNNNNNSGDGDGDGRGGKGEGEIGHTRKAMALEPLFPHPTTTTTTSGTTTTTTTTTVLKDHGESLAASTSGAGRCGTHKKETFPSAPPPPPPTTATVIQETPDNVTSFIGGGGYRILHRMKEQYEYLASPTMLSPSTGLRAFFFPMSAASAAASAAGEPGEVRGEDASVTTTTTREDKDCAGQTPSPCAIRPILTGTLQRKETEQGKEEYDEEEEEEEEEEGGWRRLGRGNAREQRSGLFYLGKATLLRVPPKLVGGLRRRVQSGFTSGVEVCRTWLHRRRESGRDGDGRGEDPISTSRSCEG